MASIEKRRSRSGSVSWRVHYRTPAGAQRNKTFDTRGDADRFAASVEASKFDGMFVDPQRAKITMGEWAETWLAGQAHLKPSTLNRYEGIVRHHVLPRWQNVKLHQVSHADVQSWVTVLARTSSPATVRKIHRVLSLMLDLAVRDGRLARNVAEKINLPRPVRHEQKYLTIAQVEALADECGYPSLYSIHRPRAERRNPGYRLVVLFLAYTGVRFGEMAALRVGRLDLERRRAVICESVTVVPGHGLVWGTPKTHQRREVPIPAFLAAELVDHVAGKGPEDLVFTGVRRGQPLRPAIFRRGHFDAAAKAIGIPDLHPHELRHTAASLAIAHGADIKVVQQMLGHHSATMTMDTYGHLFDNRLSEVSDALDAARTSQGVTSKHGPPQPPEGGPDEVITNSASITTHGLTWEKTDNDISAVAKSLPQADIISLTEYRTRSITPGQKPKKKGAPGRIRTYAPASGGRCSIP